MNRLKGDFQCWKLAKSQVGLNLALLRNCKETGLIEAEGVAWDNRESMSGSKDHRFGEDNLVSGCGSLGEKYINYEFTAVS